MIKLGRTNYWFTGDRFFFGDREKQRDLTDEDREPLLRYLCTCAFGLNRWQGEENEHGTGDYDTPRREVPIGEVERAFIACVLGRRIGDDVANW